MEVHPVGVQGDFDKLIREAIFEIV
jgi:hypothetical protein